MATADATLLPPPFPSGNERSAVEERGSVRRLDEVGVETVLEAMVAAKRRASQPAVLELELEADFAGDSRTDGDADDSPRVPSQSEVFLKAR